LKKIKFGNGIIHQLKNRGSYHNTNQIMVSNIFQVSREASILTSQELIDIAIYELKGTKELA